MKPWPPLDITFEAAPGGAILVSIARMTGTGGELHVHAVNLLVTPAELADLGRLFLLKSQEASGGGGRWRRWRGDKSIPPGSAPSAGKRSK